ncbi:MAG: hypothetical protein JSV03_12200 [Planctomycetota bacterium]|nr:MAG: hypothetical protein JSV03_12200 [Planctomycetota bacterium]
MYTHNKIIKPISYLIGGVIMMGVMGGPCDITVFPEGIISFDAVTVELVNTTAYPVEPYLYVDPDENIFSAAQIINDENFVLLDPPVQPGEIVQLSFDCDMIGSIVSDHAWLLLSDLEAIESDNGPLLTEEEEFQCGDIISFIFIDEGPGGAFFTRVEVNGRFVED